MGLAKITVSDLQTLQHSISDINSLILECSTGQAYKTYPSLPTALTFSACSPSVRDDYIFKLSAKFLY